MITLVIFLLYLSFLLVLWVDFDNGVVTQLQPIWWLVAVLLFTVFLYRNVPTLGWVYEDRNWLPYSAGWPLASIPYSVTYAPFALAQLIGRGQPWAYHVIVLGVHLLNVYLVYRLGRVLGGEWGAVLAALIFAVHPLQGESVNYVTGGREVVATSFLLLALNVGISQDYGLMAFWRGAMAVLCIGLAVDAKADAIVALLLVPAALAVTRSWRTLSVVAVGIFAVLLAQWSHIHYILTAHDGTWLASESYAAMQASALWRFALSFVTLSQFTVDHDWALATPMLHMVSLVSLISWSVLIFYRWKDWPRLALALGWVLLAVSPRFILQTREILNEHQLYMPLIGVSLALGLAFERSFHKADVWYPVALGAGDSL